MKVCVTIVVVLAALAINIMIYGFIKETWR